MWLMNGLLGGVFRGFFCGYFIMVFLYGFCFFVGVLDRLCLISGVRVCLSFCCRLVIVFEEMIGIVRVFLICFLFVCISFNLVVFGFCLEFFFGRFM